MHHVVGKWTEETGVSVMVVLVCCGVDVVVPDGAVVEALA